MLGTILHNRLNGPFLPLRTHFYSVVCRDMRSSNFQSGKDIALCLRLGDFSCEINEEF